MSEIDDTSRLRRGRPMIRRRWAVVLAGALALTALAAVAASRLSIETRLVDLLPEGSPAAEDYRLFLERFGGVELVYAVITAAAEPGGPEPGEGADPARLVEAADRLAERMARAPGVAGARSGLSAQDEEFVFRRVLPRAPLLAADPEAVARRFDPAAVRARVRELRERLRTPAGAAAADLLAADPLGFAEALAGEAAAPLAAGTGGAPVDPVSGAFLAADGSAALVAIEPAAGELDSAAGRALAAALDRAAAEVEGELGGGIEVHAAGGPLYAAQDEAILRADLVRTVTGSAVGVALVLVLAFGAVREPVALLAAVGAGIVWTGAVAALTLGAISAIGVGFASILVGLGVDYGIHGAARYRQRRLDGRPPEAAIGEVRRAIAPAVLASAATTCLAFLVLALAHFRPVRELGLVVAAGVVAVLAATVAVGAPLVVLLDRRRPEARTGPVEAPQSPGATPPWPSSTPGRPGRDGGRGDDRGSKGRLWRALGTAAEAVAGLGARRPWTVLAAAALFAAAAALALPRLEFEADPRAFRPPGHPAHAAEELLAERFGVGLDSATLVVEGSSRDQVLARAAAAATAVRRAIAAAPGSAGATVTTAADWLPPPAVLAERARARGGERAAAAAAALREALAGEGLAEAPFRPALAVLDAMAAGEPPPPVPLAEWPEWVRRGVVSERGAAVAVRLAAPLGVWPEGPPPAVIAAGLEAAPGAAVASLPRLAAELRALLAGDLRRLGGWALAAVAAAVLVSFRGRPLPALLALAPVSLGLLWTLGLVAALGVPLDAFSLLVAPLLVGIGIDDGLHAVHGAVGKGGLGLHGLHGAAASAGRAMALTTLTTAVGFGGLVLSRLPALARGGLLVALGTVLCLAATLLVLPAAGALVSRRRSRAAE
jgi:hypothetical protein